MPISRSQFRNRVERLKQKTETTVITDEISLAFMTIAKELLNLFVPTDAPPSASSDLTAQQVTLPNTEDVMDIDKTMLSAPTSIFIDEFFQRPLYGLATLYDTVDLSGSAVVPESYISGLQLMESDKSNRRVQLHIWISHALEVDAAYCKSVIQKFRSSRGFPNPIISGQINASNPASLPSQLNPVAGARRNPSVQTVGAMTTSQQPTNGGERNITPAALLPAVETAQEGNNLNNASSIYGDKNVPTTSMDQLPFSFTNNEAGNVPGGIAAAVAPSSHTTPVQGYEDPKKANYIVLSINDTKYRGDIKQDVKETIKMYDICSRQYSLSERQKSDFFIHAFGGPARRYFMANTTPSMPFVTMCDIMEREYNSDARKLQVKATVVQCLQ